MRYNADPNSDGENIEAQQWEGCCREYFRDKKGMEINVCECKIFLTAHA